MHTGNGTADEHAFPLLETLTREAEEQCKALLAAAHEEAQALLCAAREKAATTRQEVLDGLEAELETLGAHEDHRVAAEVKEERDAMRYALVEETLERVRARLDTLCQDEAFTPILDQLLREALDTMMEEGAPPEDMVIAVPPGYEGACRSRLAEGGLAEGGLEGIETEASPGLRDGIHIKSRCGTFRVSNTLTQRLAKVEGAARLRAWHTLLGTGGQGA